MKWINEKKKKKEKNCGNPKIMAECQKFRTYSKVSQTSL